MKKPVGILAITLGLMLNASYLFYKALFYPHWLVTAFAWAGVSLVAAYGIFNSRIWSQYFIQLIALFAIASWMDGTIQMYGKAWPYADTTATITAFLPGGLLVGCWIWAAAYALSYFRKSREHQKL
jgi:hypothetical protein